MCESCSAGGLNRREFLGTSGAAGAAGVLSMLMGGAVVSGAEAAPKRDKRPARVTVAFLYPPADVVERGENEDGWSKHQWFTWPGNQFEPARQEARFTQKIREMAERLHMAVEFEREPIWRQADAEAFIHRTKAAGPDGVLIVNFWNTFSQRAFQMATESAPTAIVYQPVGSNHQLPPAMLRKAQGLYYIHSIENWAEIERGLAAIAARVALSQSRLLRVAGEPKQPTSGQEAKLGVEIVSAAADEFNALFDAVAADAALQQEAMAFKAQAQRVMDVTDEYFVEAMRAHRAVEQIMSRYGADAITIECLFLKHRKPCISFAVNNGALVPCGCENDLNATLTLMLGRHLLHRAGFQHNPEFDTSENRYFGAHCTCATQLRGPGGPSQPFLVRPFFHQAPKTAALDVQWTPGEAVMLTKYHTGQDALTCWTGRVIESPTSPPTGGCATRVLVEIDRVEDVCDVYPGPHPVLFAGDRSDARRFKAFAQMYRLKLTGNV